MLMTTLPSYRHCGKTLSCATHKNKKIVYAVFCALAVAKQQQEALLLLLLQQTSHQPHSQHKKQVQFSKQQRVSLFRLKEPPMNVKFAHVVLSVAHQAAPFAARVLDQMITDIVAHGPEVAQELAIDSFQCELDRFTRVAYPPLSPEGNCSLALSMHHLPQCFGTRH